MLICSQVYERFDSQCNVTAVTRKFDFEPSSYFLNKPVIVVRILHPSDSAPVDARRDEVSVT